MTGVLVACAEVAVFALMVRVIAYADRGYRRAQQQETSETGD